MSSDPSLKESSKPAKMVPLGKFEVLAHIATGGMGAVYRARDTETGREVALKVLNPKMAARPDALQRFHAEAHNAAQLRHENIVTVYEVGEEKGVTYLAMEFVEGIDLADHINKKGRLDIEEARLIIFQATRALLHAHKRGIVHRDIKPSNFLLSWKEGKLNVKLTDYGLSRQVDDDEFRVTREGFTVGTIDYISPEQARDSRSADTRSDIYSLGCTLYHMLTGQPPFPDGGLAERIYKHMEVEPADVRESRPDVPPGLAEIAQRMLAKKPEDRYQTPRELLQALTQAEQAAPDPGRATRPTVREKPRAKSSPRPKKEAASTEIETPRAGPRIKQPDTVAEPVRKPPASKPVPDAPPSHRAGILLGLAGAAVLLGVIVLLILRPWKIDAPDDPGEKPVDPLTVERPPIKVDTNPDLKDKKTNPDPNPPKTTWPPLRADNPVIDRERLTKSFTEGWEAKALPADLPVFRVRRQSTGGGDYPSLAAAAKAVQEKGGVGPIGSDRLYDAIIEVEDNGPLYETSLALTGKNVLIRAAAGYRPLLYWDVEREREKPLPPFMSVQEGRLGLEGLEIVLSPPKPIADVRAALVRITRGDFMARRCCFSVAGAHPAGVALARLEGHAKDGKPARCRLSRCQARGGSLVGLDLDSGTRHVLLDDTLLATGEMPVFDIRVHSHENIKLNLLRSTLVSRSAGIRVRAEESEPLPADTFELNAWDVLLARSGPGREGVLLDLPQKLRADAVRWRATNCLYSGWKSLLRGATEIEGSDTSGWEQRWASFNVERVEKVGWPAALFPEVAEVPIAEYSTQTTPGEPVGFAVSSWPCLALSDKNGPALTIGCPTPLLPQARDRWLQWTTQQFVTPAVELLGSSPPGIPAMMDGLFHGERIDVTKVDLGEYLEQMPRSRRLAPRVVLQLFRSTMAEPKPLSAIRLKDVDLVLVLEPFKKGMGKDATTEPLVLQPAASLIRNTGSFIELENGSLNIHGGEIQAADFTSVIKIKAGSLRLHDVRLTAPIQPPRGFEALIVFQGGELARKTEGRDQTPNLAIDDAVLVSGRSGILIQGNGARLRLVQSVIAAGVDAIALEPGSEARSRMNLSCSLENVTVAASRAAIRVGAVAGTVPPEEPIVIHTRSCAFLNPFGIKAGLLLTEGETLQRGTLLWQGEQDVYDRRLQFGAATLKTIPEKVEGMTGWQGVWGAGGSRRATLDFAHANRFDADRWSLDRLALSARPDEMRGIGADLQKLGVFRRRPR
jgi:serine/threonine-protein kinase